MCVLCLSHIHDVNPPTTPTQHFRAAVAYPSLASGPAASAFHEAIRLVCVLACVGVAACGTHTLLVTPLFGGLLRSCTTPLMQA